MVRVKEILVEHHQKCDTIGIGESKPRLSWRFEDPSDGWIQEKFELSIKGAGLSYNGVTRSSQSTFVEWPARPLESRESVEVAVRVKGQSDVAWSEWSEPATIEVALSNSDFEAAFISASEPKTPREVLFRKVFNTVEDRQIVKGRLYSTAKGVYEVEINGHRVGHDVLSPGWTSYPHRIIQKIDDVGPLLEPGPNAIGIRLADGWFSGLIGWSGDTCVYGDTNMAFAQLEVSYADGSVQIIPTDESWKWTYGPTMSASLYMGETYDAREEISGWSSYSLDDDNWKIVAVHPLAGANIVPPVGPPIRQTQTVAPVRIFKSSSGKTIVDFGQNLAGIVHLKNVKGPEGHRVTLRHAEVMEDGELATRPLRTAKSTDEYILNGNSHGEEWTPRFVYHGFRYVQVDNWPHLLNLNSIEAIVIHSDFERTGWFDCSNKQLNKLHENVCWSMRSNFMSLPTDCPQRDERLGWTGDIQMFGPSANYLYRCQGLLKSWLLDLSAEQEEFGAPPIVCPTPFRKCDFFLKDKLVAAWQDAVVLVPWQIFQQTGDAEILRSQYQSMKNYLEQIPRDINCVFWDPDQFQFGDWLDPDAPPQKPEKGRTDPALVSNAYLILSTEIVAAIAALLGYHADSEKYSAQVKVLREAFEKEYITPSCHIASYSQTAYALAIIFRLLDGADGSLWKENSPDHLTTAGDVLEKIVRSDGYQIGTGFVGTPVLCDALVKSGHVDVAYKLLLNDKPPSWLYPITMGATTIWERWDSVLPNGKINPGEMTSFNHYAFGAIADWMRRTIGGLNCAAPGWSKILIRPLPGGGLTYAKVMHDTLFGKVSCSWRIEESKFFLEVNLPGNVRGIVELPNGEKFPIGSGTHTFVCVLAAK